MNGTPTDTAYRDDVAAVLPLTAAFTCPWCPVTVVGAGASVLSARHMIEGHLDDHVAGVLGGTAAPAEVAA